MGIIKSISKIALTPSVAVGNVIVAGLEKITGKKYGRTTTEELASTTAGKVLGTAIAGTAAALTAATIAAVPAAAAATRETATKAAAVVKANPIKTAIAAPIITGAVISQPEKAAKAIVQTPFQLGNVGANIANLAASPSIEGVKELVTENPVIVGTAIAAGTALGIKGVAQAAATFGQTQAIQAQTQAIKEITPSGITTLYATPSGITMLPSYEDDYAEKTPLSKVTTPMEETYNIEEKPKKATKRKKKKALEPRRQTISQRVNVQVGVNSGNKKYIKNTILVPA